MICLCKHIKKKNIHICFCIRRVNLGLEWMKHLSSHSSTLLTSAACGCLWNSSPLLWCSCSQSLRSHSCRPAFPFFSQYIYETNENGDKVVLGKGTYGVVYAGRDLSNQVRIAIKEIPEKDSTYENTHPLFFFFSHSELFLAGKQSCTVFSQECLFPK